MAFPTEEQLAREAEAVSRAYEDWLEAWEDRIELPEAPDGPSEVPAFAELVAAPDEAQADLTRRIAAAKAGLGHPTFNPHAAPPAAPDDFGPFAPDAEAAPEPEGDDGAP